MKRLHLLILKSYIGPLIATFFIALFVLLMQFLWRYIEDLVGKGLEWTVIAEFLLYASAGLVPMALPLSILLSSIMTFGNLGENYELTAIKSAGISLQRMMIPLIFLTGMISVGAFFFSNKVLPYTNLQIGALLWDINHQNPEMNIKEGIFNKDVKNFRIKISSKNKQTGMMYDFMIYDHRDKKGNIKVSIADSGTMQVTADEKYMIVELYGGMNYEEVSEVVTSKRPQVFPHRQDSFSKQTIILELENLDLKRTDTKLFSHHHGVLDIMSLNVAEDSLVSVYGQRESAFIKNLARNSYFRFERKIVSNLDSTNIRIDSMKRLIPMDSLYITVDLDSLYGSMSNPDKAKILDAAIEYSSNARNLIVSTSKDFKGRKEWIAKHKIAWHMKFTLSFACIVFFFIGAPLGAIIRKGGFGISFVMSIFFFIFYYVISLTGKKFAAESIVPAYVGMWVSSGVLLPIGIFLTSKATSDSVLFNKEAYVDFFSRPLKALRKRQKQKTLNLIFANYDKNISATEFTKLSESMFDNIKEYVEQINFYLTGANKQYFDSDLARIIAIFDQYSQYYAVLSERSESDLYFKGEFEKLPILSRSDYRWITFDGKRTFFMVGSGLFLIRKLIARVAMRNLRNDLIIIRNATTQVIGLLNSKVE